MFLDKIRSREKFSKSDIFKQNLADILFDKKNFYLKPDRIFCTFGKLIYLHALDASCAGQQGLHLDFNIIRVF